MCILVKCVCLLWSVISACGRPNVNVALNRPSYVSSYYSDADGPWSASKGNDGNKVDCSHLSLPHSMTASAVEPNPWYGVDLGVPIRVHSVALTNRATGTVPVQRNDNFIVGMTDVSPTVQAPTLWNYDVCGQYPGAVPAGATVNLTCKCGMAGHRYLILQFDMTDSLNFCEVEVFLRRWEWKQKDGYKMINKVASSLQVDHRVYCGSNCTFSPICDSYNYRASDKTCQLNSHDDPLQANSADIVADSDWIWFRAAFTVIV